MHDRVNGTRRRLAQLGALAPALARTLRAYGSPEQRLQSSGRRAALAELGYRQVQLCSGPLQRQAGENHALLMNLDEDSLLRPYRLRAGLPAPGTDLGGWYDSDAFAPGATFGQWMSALCRYHAISGDGATRAKVQRLVAAYAASIDPQGKFYRHNRFPAYIYDKLVGGLIDAHRHAQDIGALPALMRTTQPAAPYFPAHAMPHGEGIKAGEDFSKHAWAERYTLAENQFFAWRETGDAHYYASARRFLYDEFFAALAAGHNALPGKHAYSHVNSLSSAPQAYPTLRPPMPHRPPDNALPPPPPQTFAPAALLPTPPP